MLIREYFLERFDIKRTAEYSQGFISLIISILKRVDYSDKKVELCPFNFFQEKIATNEYIDALVKFAYILEDDSVQGFEKAFYLLKGLSRRYPDGIPIKSKSRIYSLLFACSHYAWAIIAFDYEFLEPKLPIHYCWPSYIDVTISTINLHQSS